FGETTSKQTGSNASTCVRLVKLQEAVSILGGIFVDAFSDFFTEPACLDVLHQQGTGPIFLTKALMKKIQDTQPCVEPDQVDHFERSHWVVQTQLQCLINVSGAGNSFLQHIERFVADEGIDPRGYKAR